MATKTLNISVPEEMFNWLKQNPDLSPSKIFQAKVLDVENTKKNAEQELLIARSRINRLIEEIQHLHEEIQRIQRLKKC